MIYQTEKALTDLGDKITDDEKAKINTAVDALKEALKGTDLEAIKSKQEELQKEFYAISEKLYQQANPQGAPGADPMGGANNADPNVYDADFKDVTDDDNK